MSRFGLTALLLCALTGCDRKPLTISLTPSSGVMAVGLSQQFTAIGHYSNGKNLPLTDATWSVSKPDVISISATGVVTAKAPGKAQVVAQVEGSTVLATVMVTPLAVQSIILEPLDPRIPMGNTLTLTPTVTYTNRTVLTLRDGAQAPGIEYHTLWHSSNDAVASVDVNGVVTMHQAIGSATITLSLGEVEASVVVTAAQPTLSALSITASQPARSGADPSILWLRRGESLQLNANATNSTGSSVTADKLTWDSDDASIVVFRGPGLITAVSPGQTRVFVSSGGVTGERSVMVEE